MSERSTEIRPATSVAGGLAAIIREAAHPLTGGAEDYRPLMELIGDARFVLIGEASHGTDEFYRERARITRILIEEKGFDAVAVEADWPDAYRVNRYVRGRGEDTSADAALGGFERFPTWMWRNTAVVELVDWVRGRNVGFYGLDLYSLYSSIGAVVQYLEKVDPEAARRARQRYACFEEFGQDSQAYGYASAFGGADPCEEGVVAQLVELRERADRYALLDEDEFFYAEQNARLARNAEEYYRAMYRGRVSSWNLRDRHMAETLDALVEHLIVKGRPGKIVVWEHNSHLGDARATEMGEGGELNVGQLVRERRGREAVLIGMTTHHGWVTAADYWDMPAERKRVRPALAGSHEELFHGVGLDRFLLTLRLPEARHDVAAALASPRLERAIGVIYRPDTERMSHYFHARLAAQFDAVIHVDETHALEPLERTARWDTGEAPGTFPRGL
jgi:erythromycin esterase-like protein